MAVNSILKWSDVKLDIFGGMLGMLIFKNIYNQPDFCIVISSEESKSAQDVD